MDSKVNDPEMINDLIKINNDRIAGYRTALDLAHSMHIDDLGGIFAKYILQSERFITELTPHVIREGEQPTHSTMLSGKLFRLWMNIKVSVAGNDRKSLLESCEKGEDAFIDMYKKILEEDSESLSVPVQHLIGDQLSRQLVAHDEVKALRDSILTSD